MFIRSLLHQRSDFIRAQPYVIRTKSDIISEATSLSATALTSLGGIAAYIIARLRAHHSPLAAGLIGKVTVKVVPASSDEQTTVPPCSSTIALTSESPTPLPRVEWEGSS